MTLSFVYLKWRAYIYPICSDSPENPNINPIITFLLKEGEKLFIQMRIYRVYFGTPQKRRKS